MKYLFFAFLFFPFFAESQVQLTGKVTLDDIEVVGATVEIGNQSKLTDDQGNFKFELVRGSYEIHVTYAYISQTIAIAIDENKHIDIELDRAVSIDEVVVSALRADKFSPIAYTEMDKEELEQLKMVEDIPYLLKWEPSVVVASDAGAGVGYTNMRIRGTDPTRINVTINGIPYNDSESQGTFWVNLPDLVASADDIQIQRGVGTSTLGAGAFGGSINIKTNRYNEEAYGSITGTLGSFNSRSATVAFGTGLIDDKFSLDGRLSKINSDGYIDRASSDLSSYYLSASYKIGKTSLNAITFGGKEKTYQAWYGVPYQYINSNPTFNPAGTEKEGEPYDNQVDDYQQFHYQLHASTIFSPKITFNTSLHYTRGMGFYEEYKADEDFEDYKLTAPENVESTDLIRRKWLDNHFYGVVSNLRLKYSGNSDVNFGLGVNNYIGDHFGEVQWAEYMIDSEKGMRYYENDAEKLDLNVYVKNNIGLTSKLNAYVDLQYRYINYQFEGIDEVGGEIKNVNKEADHNFFNPKVGLVYEVNENHRLYASVGVANKEPNRNDYTENIFDLVPESERLIDYELGYDTDFDKLDFSANLYFMTYKNQLVLNGQVNDVGAYTRINVDNSYRAGVELYGQYEILANSFLLAGATFSQNKIIDFVNYIDNWDSGEQYREELGDTDIAFSPNVLAQLGISYRLLNISQAQRNHLLDISLMNKFVGKQYIDNTQDDQRSLDSYHYSDLQLRYTFSMKNSQSISLKANISNLFDQDYIANAWTYQYISESYDPRDDNYYSAKDESQNRYYDIGYYPQAGIRYNVSLTLSF